jgi:ribose 5-phosphate isomerase B
MRVGIAADHGGYHLKVQFAIALERWGYTMCDFGAKEYRDQDDFPDYVIPLGKAVARKEIERGIAVCSSGVGACIAANKIRGVRAALISDIYSAHQGVEDDDMNVLCLGAKVSGEAVAMDLLHCFLTARFKAEERFLRRIAKISTVEIEGNTERNR